MRFRQGINSSEHGIFRGIPKEILHAYEPHEIFIRNTFKAMSGSNSHEGLRGGQALFRLDIVGVTPHSLTPVCRQVPKR